MGTGEPTRTGWGRSGRRTAIVLAALAGWLLAASAAAALPWPLPELPPQPPLQQDEEVDPVRTASSSIPQHKRVRIARKPGHSRVAVLTLSSAKLRKLRAGDYLQAAAEIQLSTCLKPGRGISRNDCRGRMYGFNPRIGAHVALAAQPGDASRAKTRRITPKVRSGCTQKQPDRNHHCVLSVPWGGLRMLPRERLPCKIRRCRLNLIVSAWHPRAQRRQYVVVGGFNAEGGINVRRKSRLVAARFRAQGRDRPELRRARKPKRATLPVGRPSGHIDERVVQSVRIDDPRAGDSLLVDARFASSISHLSYSTRTRTQIVLAGRPTSSRGNHPGARRAAHGPPVIAHRTVFNCTQGRSGHRTPCRLRKRGVIELRRDARGPLYVNLVAGHGAVKEARRRWKPRHRARILPGRNHLRVVRYRR